ncbi:HAD-IIB family hydrolase [Pseudooceanicola algae]|uniref:Mannosyl-3-phosphoglycerate phosphatase n=1 Tax=Pseudooceanicola algae TaxID=1537215 RepID=A0A418SDH1_9RHOB|nr:HAD hydrolase family protein [Pseudooceanicola algae]QPM89405.1 Mannosyl-3-phosphoglycerate phosphatase [Pseudooceanicola algae]
MTQPPFIVFTDLDGTLLDHASYSYDAALPALAALKDLGVPVILASSKTGPEIAVLRDELGLAACPAIVENGAGLLPAHAAPEVGGHAYRDLRRALDVLPPALRGSFRGFGDLGPHGVAENAGLPPEQAAMACRRSFSEPGIWSGSAADEAAFVAVLAKSGISARRGGRYLTLSHGGTKADRMVEVAAQYGAGRSVALGDAPNDAEMLASADIGIVIANPHGNALPDLAQIARGEIRRSTKFGPEGWNEMMLPLLSEWAL